MSESEWVQSERERERPIINTTKHNTTSISIVVSLTFITITFRMSVYDAFGKSMLSNMDFDGLNCQRMYAYFAIKKKRTHLA